MSRSHRPDHLAGVRRARPMLGPIAAGILLTTLALTSCSSSSNIRTQPVGPGGSDRIAAAERAFEAGQTDRARAEFVELTSPALPSSIRGRAHLGLGRVALRASDFETALQRLGEARTLLRRDDHYATAELLHGVAAIRCGRYQSGINSLERSFQYLVSADDRRRAAYLIHRTCELTGTSTPARYRELARGVHLPEYDEIYDAYVVDPDSIPRALPPPPRPVAPKPTSTVAKRMGTVKIVGRKQWGARPTRSNVNPNSRWSKITVHHTADQGSMVPLGRENTVGYLRRLQEYFQNIKGYADIPYHYLIASDGKAYEGRPLLYQGAHAGGAANQQNIGIALIGNFQAMKPTKSQLNSMKFLISNLRGKHRISQSRVYAHCDLKTTDCPGKQLQKELRTMFGSLPADPDATHAFCDHGSDAGAPDAAEAHAN